jgi:hypothetical protein
MPAGLADRVAAEGGRASLMAPTNDSNDYLGGTNYRVGFWADTNADGAISIYGWIDPTDWSGSMHMPLNGFAIGVPWPECAPIADFTGDCVVDYEDLKIMVDEWLERGCCEADLYKDYKVDFKDFVILANNWLKEGMWP